MDILFYEYFFKIYRLREISTYVVYIEYNF
jgi:hypothetical protein